ncbi:hypothetical protein DK52_3246 [Brucella abortus]|nr:hypothetical protein DK52_3246 [Brucella abortus]
MFCGYSRTSHSPLGLVCIQGFPFVRNSDSRLLKENSLEQTKPYR